MKGKLKRFVAFILSAAIVGTCCYSPITLDAQSVREGYSQTSEVKEQVPEVNSKTDAEQEVKQEEQEVKQEVGQEVKQEEKQEDKQEVVQEPEEESEVQEEKEESKVQESEEAVEKKSLSETLLDINIAFYDKIQSLVQEEDLYKSLKDIKESDRIAFLCSLTVEECYQYTVFMQHEFLLMLKEGYTESDPVLKKERLSFILTCLEENSSFLEQKMGMAPLNQEKVVLEEQLFKTVLKEAYSEYVYVEDKQEKTVDSFSSFRKYLQQDTDIDLEKIYASFNCYLGETKEGIEKLREDCVHLLYTIYQVEEPKKETEEETKEEGQEDKESVEEKEDIEKETTEDKEAVEDKENKQDDKKDVEEKKDKDTEEQKKDVEEKRDTDLVVTDVEGQGVLDTVASRSIDIEKNYRSTDEGVEEKYYEVYASTSSNDVKKLKVDISVEDSTETFEAKEGNYEVEGEKYNYRLQVPYDKLPLEDTDGMINANLTALGKKNQTLGTLKATPRLASGVYNVIKNYVGPDFSILNTNKSREQIYYVYGTVWSDNYGKQYIGWHSTDKNGAYYTLSISSYDSNKATVKLRDGGQAEQGTWLKVFGRTTLNNLSIIGSSKQGQSSLGLVSAKNPANTNANTRQSYLSATNCSFTRAEKWGIHGDRNSYLNVDGCTITNTKGGVGSHGQIDVRNSTLDGTNSPYSGWAGVHLNVPITQGAFAHGVNLENNTIKGYALGIEYGVSNYFSDQPAGNRITSFSMDSTGWGNNISNCSVGIQTTNIVDIPLSVNLGSSINDIYNCSVGIRTSTYRDTISKSGGNIHHGTVGVDNNGTFNMSGGSIYSYNNPNWGGGIVNKGSCWVGGGSIHSNSAPYGGGIYSTGTLSISGGSITSNYASNYGGGIFANTGILSGISNATISNNTAGTYGGGLFTNLSTTLTKVTMTGNRANSNDGGGIYLGTATLNLNSSNISSNYAQTYGGGICTWKGNINFNSGWINSNVAGNHGGGVFIASSADARPTFSMGGGEISWNRTNTYGGGIYDGSYSTVNVRGGNITGNTASHGGGIFTDSNSITTNISGGTINGNKATAAGGAIFNNKVINITGGSIHSNTGGSSSGIYQSGTMYMSGGGTVNTNNTVYLASGKFVTVNGALSSATVAHLTPSDSTLGRVCVRTTYSGGRGSAVFNKFRSSLGSPYLLRPGDYQSGSGVKTTDAVVSRTYALTYNQNYNGTVTNMPGNQTKYWYETLKLSTTVPVLSGIRFKGWSENAKSDVASYQPGNNISASVNRGVNLYAIWEAKVKVTYAGNYATSGTPKSEYVTKEQCDKNNGYYNIRKNAGYTNFARSNYSFVGWNENKIPTNKAIYSEAKQNKITFKKLMDLAKQNATTESVPVAIFYDVWDAKPQIKANDVQTFYEGTKVTKNMLLSNVKAVDKEDGDITKNVRIISISYSDGKLVNGNKQKGVQESWKVDMPNDYQLDTWFQQLDSKDSPVVHKITYAVTDSAGNVTTLNWTLKVKYNEFPVIKTEDRYFTLEEAQKGVITEKLLVEDALKDKKVTVTDLEDDKLYPGTLKSKLKIKDFKSEEFTSFTDSGFVVLTYSVNDSMGPNGKGKESFCQFTVHIEKDGEIVEPEPTKHVRFINEEYYRKNEQAATQDLTKEEKAIKNKNGGLNVDSKWYHDSEYKSAILSTWGDSTPQQRWVFSPEDVLKVKEYIETNGIGNSINGNGLSGFIEKFGYLKR